ncbi:hypothetical protein ILYODFUR_032130, partial [Ilyodon furcidens]
TPGKDKPQAGPSKTFTLAEIKNKLSSAAKEGKPLPKSEQKFENFVRTSYKVTDKKPRLRSVGPGAPSHILWYVVLPPPNPSSFPSSPIQARRSHRWSRISGVFCKHRRLRRSNELSSGRCSRLSCETFKGTVCNVSNSVSAQTKTTVIRDLQMFSNGCSKDEDCYHLFCVFRCKALIKSVH